MWAPDHRFCPLDGTPLEQVPDGEEPRGRTAPSDVPRHMPQVGDLLEGKYQLGEIIGTGGMGVVFKARHERIDRWVAIKVLRPEVVGDATQVKRFMEEARLAGSIGHEGIVEVIDLVSTSSAPPYIVMELLEGSSLSQYLKRKRVLPPPRALKITMGILEALDAAHQREIIHRDVKPGNVFLARKKGLGELIKLLDFGIARALRDNVRVTTPGRAVGTAVFMPPEQIMSSEVDARADLYAVAAVLYLMLAGRPPFKGRSWPELARDKLSTTIPPLEHLSPSLASQLERLVKRGLERDPDDRPSTALDYRREINDTLEAISSDDRARASQIPTLTLRRQRRVAVLPFRVDPPDHPESWLGDAIAVSLYDDLVSRPGLQVIDASLVSAAVSGKRGRFSSTPTALGHELDAGFVISGEIGASMGDFRLEIAVLDSDSGEVVAKHARTGTVDDIFRLLRASLEGVGKPLHLQPPADANEAPVHERGIDALRAYVQAVKDLTSDESSPAAPIAEALGTLAAADPKPGALHRHRARALFRLCIEQGRPDLVKDLSAELDRIAGSGCSDPWVPIGRAALRHCAELFDPLESAVLAEEHRVVHGFNARVLLEEASALENIGKPGDASMVLSMILEHDRTCVPAIVRLALLDLAPAPDAEHRPGITTEHLDRAAFLLRSASRLQDEERVEGGDALSRRRGWPRVPDLRPVEALLAFRKDELALARRLVENAVPAGGLMSALLIETVQGLLTGDPDSPRLRALMPDVLRSFEIPRNHEIREIAWTAPEVWTPVLSSWLDMRPDHSQLRLVLANVLRRTGDNARAHAEAKLVAQRSLSAQVRRLADKLVQVIELEDTQSG